MVSDIELSYSAPVNDGISPGNDAWNDQRNGHGPRRIILASSTEEKWRRLDVLAVDLLNPSPAAEAKKHKLKTLVPAPRSFFMDVKCPGCFAITTVFSHAQTVVICQGCTTVLCQPTGGKARLTEGCSFRRK
ncbi:40S ribosomal protein S27 [Claviceps sp. Clav32 group G5]|nr:40S ribosomal protein S27 [Claviceps sp. Clav32 group G5]KAG6045199.1 40S ribosomal protein S27 [Claviceps sp. Clav50 group G5]